ncbi:MAG: hypothetical protein GY716_01995 [bacterium]|nr:hypothetical protein [bacterium]
MRSRLLLISILVAAIPAVGLAHAETISVGGRVQLPDGTPYPQAEARLYPVVDSVAGRVALLEGTTPEPEGRALTDEDGHFRLHAPHAGLWRVRIEAPGMAPLEAALLPLIEPIELQVAELAVDAGLRVRVLNEDGKAIRGATVLVATERSRYEFGGSPWRVPLRGGVTDDEGAIVLPRREFERTRISAFADGLVAAERRSVGGTAATLRMKPGTPREVVVHGADGRPAPAVRIALGDNTHPAMRTDDEGRATLRLGSTEPLAVHLAADDGREADVRVGRASDPDAPPKALTLPDRFTIGGMLIDSESRRPIAGGVVWDVENPSEAALSNDSGGFEIGGPEGRRLRMVSGATGYLGGSSLKIHLVDDGRPDPTLALDPGAAVEGRVVDGNGDPVAGVEIEVEVKHTPGMMRFEIGGQVKPTRNLSDAQGKFRLGPLDPDKSYRIKGSAEGYAPGETSAGDLEPRKTVRGVELTLQRGRRVIGRVVDESGHPVPDAKLTLKRATPKRGGMMMMMGGDDGPSFSGESDGSGEFAIVGVPTGTFDLDGQRSGFARGEMAAIEVPEEADEVVDAGELVLKDGVAIQGRVTDSDGQPIEGTKVYIESKSAPMMFMGEGQGPEPDALTDPAGWFEVRDLTEGKAYTFSLRRSGYVEAKARGIEAPNADPVEVSMDPASNISGLVLTAEDGTPIAGAEVVLSRRQTIEMGGNMMMTMMMEDTTTDSEGRFVFEDQAPGKISLRGVATGYQEAKRDNVEVPKGEDLEGVELPLDAGAFVQGRVYAPDGRPMPGARVQLAGDGGGPFRMMGQEADGNGFYRLEGLEPGAQSVEAHHDDYPRAVKDIEVEPGVNALDLHFEGGVEVSGRVVSTSGEGIPDASARLAPKGRFWGGPATTTDGQGNFKIPGVQNGDYDLLVQAEGYAGSEGTEEIKVEGEPVLGLEIRLDAGGSIFGRVDGLTPEELREVSVRVSPSFDFFEGIAVDAEGNYRVENLRPGTYSVTAQVQDTGRQARGEVKLEDGVLEQQLDLQFEAGFDLDGTVLQGEAPVVGATVFLEGLDREYVAWDQTDQDGAFRLEGLEAGRYRVNVRDFQSGLAHQEEVDVAASRSVEVQVPSVTVSGVIVDNADRQPLSGVAVTLTSPEAGQHGGFPTQVATSDLEGRFRLSNIANGNWRLSAKKKGYSAVNRDVLVQFDNDVDDVELKMDATEGVVVEVRMPSGMPASEARLAVLDHAGQDLLSGNYSTGENGRVRLTSVPPGNWELLAGAAGAATSSHSVQSPGAPVAIALPPATRLEVSVPELSGDGSIATVRIEDSSGRPFRTLGWGGKPQAEWRMSGGRIEFGSLPPGNWTVVVSGAGGKTWRGTQQTAPGTSPVLLLE